MNRRKYRADIDGLRAIAVLSVVGFHAFPSWIGGGFIGVDIFFVISGYLISAIIFEGLERGEFSFTEFYARRIKRIFPALILVLIASYIAGWFILLADEYKQLGMHIAAGATFVSNFILWSEAGYFDNSAELKPLLHLWSLGIEEQFYIVWPLLLWLIWKGKLNLLGITLLITLCSFSLNVKEVGDNAVATFYSPQTRFWELLCGILLAGVTSYSKGACIFVNIRLGSWLGSIIHRAESKGSGALYSVISCVGLLLLTYSFFKINKNFSFPGVWAIFPVLGTVLVISAGPDAWINRTVLSNRVLVWFGLISFPLYLWHWPLLSFARLVESENLNINVRIAAVLISILLAWLTYRFVERPMRLEKYTKAKVILLIVLMVVVGFIGYITYKKDGLMFRFPKIVQGLSSYKYEFSEIYRLGTCFLQAEQNYKDFGKCKIESLVNGKIVLLWGDSHAAHLYPGYKARFANSFRIEQRTASGCPPILDFENPSRVHCKDINANIFSFVKDARPKRVVLAAAWTHYDLVRLDDTVIRLKQLGVEKIDLVGPVPQWVDGLPKQLYLYFNNNVPHVIPNRMSAGLNQNFIFMDEVLRRRATALEINYISPKDILCDVGGCITMIGGTLTAWDYAHLTSSASEFLVANFPEL